MVGSPADVIDKLCGTFQPIAERWEQAMATDSGLWELTKGKSAAGILEADIQSIGQFFALADKQGARAEFALLAECIAHIRLRGSSLPKRAVLELEIDKIFAELSLQIDHAANDNAHAAAPISAPLSWRLAQYLASRGKCSSASVDALAECFMDIANLFVFRDGNVTPDEDTKLKVYHAAFGR